MSPSHEPRSSRRKKAPSVSRDRSEPPDVGCYRPGGKITKRSHSRRRLNERFVKLLHEKVRSVCAFASLRELPVLRGNDQGLVELVPPTFTKRTHSAKPSVQTTKTRRTQRSMQVSRLQWNEGGNNVGGHRPPLQSHGFYQTNPCARASGFEIRISFGFRGSAFGFDRGFYQTKPMLDLSAKSASSAVEVHSGGSHE
jgi:hypothetical protein